MSIPGIRFNDCMFSEPAVATAFAVPKCAGLLVVLASDPNWAPKAFQPLYFGEFGNNLPVRTLPFNYPQLHAAAHGRPLMVSVLPLPYTTTAQRHELLHQLLAAYNPEFQREGNLPAPALMANFAALYPPQQPEAPRRRIGFLPDVEKAA